MLPQDAHPDALLIIVPSHACSASPCAAFADTSSRACIPHFCHSGPMLIDEQIHPQTFGPWRDLLRWERMRGYVDGIEAFCPPHVIDTLLWVSETSTASTKLSEVDLSHLFRAYPSIRVVLTAFPKTATKVIAAARTSRPGGVQDLRVTTYDESDEVRELWSQGLIYIYQTTQRTDFQFGLVPALTAFVPALMHWRLDNDLDNASSTIVAGETHYYAQQLPEVLLTPVFRRTLRMQADLLDSLFEIYDTTQAPTVSGDVNITVDMETHELDLDTVARDFTLRGEQTATWTDSRLQWDERWALPAIAIPITGEWPALETRVWRPILRPVRSKDFKVDMNPWDPNPLRARNLPHALPM